MNERTNEEEVKSLPAKNKGRQTDKQTVRLEDRGKAEPLAPAVRSLQVEFWCYCTANNTPLSSHTRGGKNYGNQRQRFFLF